ncbi:hypothetical protein EG329_010909 [Mollisiaceae sp. DMI_Dod_QoI]|nr:hypothetical protein EG329_010909 [Helotiales sp. DMI_Dod_QoI]
MQSQQPLRWARPPVPRAKPVPPEKWEEHETELRELYDKMKLDDLVVAMKIRHSFTPSRRQYISQFEKWNVRKYQSTYGSRSVVPQSLAAIDPVLPEHEVEATQTPHLSNTKRQRSLQSARSSQISIGSRERPPVPPKKRQLLSESRELKDPYSDLGMAFDSFEASPLEMGIPMPPDVVTSSPAATPYDGSIEQTRCAARMSSLLGEDIGCDAPHTPEGMSLVSSVELADSVWDDYEPSPECTPRASTDQLAHRERRIDSSRPIESFSHDELQDMKLAADCLFSLTFDEEAFPLNVLLVKHIKQNNQYDPKVICTALIACAQSCTLTSQLEIAQSLLNQTLDEGALSMNEAEKFVCRMLLADIYTRRRRYKDAITQVKLAWLSVPSYENFFQCLPLEHRSLDLYLYHYMSRCVPSHQDLTDDDASDSYINPEMISTMQESGFRDQILERKPGPFELQDGRFNNPCLRSCITWCNKEIQGTVSEPSAWKKIINRSGQQRFEDVAATLIPGTRKTTSRKIQTALTYALELYLWQRWQILKSNPSEQHGLLWACQADNLMGIPASDLLGIVAKVIIQQSCYVDVKLSPGLLSYAQFGARYLSRMSDMSVGKKFLFVFSYARHVEPMESDPTDGLNLLSWRGIFNLNSQDIAVRKVARSYAIDCIEKTLSLCLPEVHDQEPAAPSNHSQTSLHILCAAVLPTLASSLRSSQLSSLRILRDRMQQNVRSAMQDTVMTLPSAMFRGSNITLPSVDQLSQAMASTLSLFPLHQGSDTVLNMLADMSDNVMDRVSDIRRNGSNLMERLIDSESEDDEMDY